MTALITLTSAGNDTGPFNLYSNSDGFISAFASNVTKQDLLLGYSSMLPDTTTEVRIKSEGVCNNFLNIPLTV